MSDVALSIVLGIGLAAARPLRRKLTADAEAQVKRTRLQPPTSPRFFEFAMSLSASAELRAEVEATRAAFIEELQSAQAHD